MGRSSSVVGLSWSVLAAAALLACGGSQPGVASPAEPGAEPAADSSGGDALVWSDSLSTKDKGIFMKKMVMPAMSKVFKEYDAEDYAKFGCKTCHGPSMKPKPIEALPVLHFKDGKMAEADTKPEVVKFMHDSVVPAMAELFGKKPNDGFDCSGCHKVE